MTDLTIEHEGETFYWVPGTEMPADAPFRGRRWSNGNVNVSDGYAWPDPTTHYAVTAAQRIAMLGMVAAKGGFPDDLDPVGYVLLRDGSMCQPHQVSWWDAQTDNPVIGYTPLAKPATPALPTYDPATHVPVRRMMEGEIDALFLEWDSDGSGTFRSWFLRRLGILIEPTPSTRFEALCAKHGVTPGQPFDEALFDKIMGADK